MSNTQAKASPGRPSPETLRELYVVQQQSLAEIARPLGVSKALVGKWLRRAGIPARTISEGTKLAMHGFMPTEAHKAKLRVNAAAARARRTPESARKQSESMKGRRPYNVGVPWTPEQRVKLEAARADPEYRERMRQRHTGENNVNWKGGTRPELDRRLGTAEWGRTRRVVYERDRWLCQVCGCKCLGAKDARAHPKRKIQCHHIVARIDGGGDELNNLITVCSSCHRRLDTQKEGGPRCSSPR